MPSVSIAEAPLRSGIAANKNHIAITRHRVCVPVFRRRPMGVGTAAVPRKIVFYFRIGSALAHLENNRVGCIIPRQAGIVAPGIGHNQVGGLEIGIR